MTQKVNVTLTLTIDDEEVAGYLVLAASDDPIAWGLDGAQQLSDAVSTYILDALAPSYPEEPDADLEAFFDRYGGREWLKGVSIDADFADDDQGARRGQQ